MDTKLMNCTRCELCGTAETIYSSTFVEYSILLRLLLSPLATMGIAILSVAILKSKGIHSNAKLILIAMTVSAVTCNIGILVDALYKFFISNVMPSDMQCDYQVFNPQYFVGIRNIEIIGSTALFVSPIALALERTVATIFYRGYNSTVTSTTPILGLVLVIIQLIVCILPMLYVRVPKQMYPYSAPEIYNYNIFHQISMVETLVNMAALLIFVILCIVNRYRRKIIGNSHLQVVLARYDVQNNIATTKLMGPVAATIFLISFSGEIVFALFAPNYDVNTVVTHDVLNEVAEYSEYSEYQLTIIPILTICIVIIMPMLSRKLRKSFMRVSHLSLCFSSKVRDLETRSSSESSDVYIRRVEWTSKANQLNYLPQLSPCQPYSTRRTRLNI